MLSKKSLDALGSDGNLNPSPLAERLTGDGWKRGRIKSKNLMAEAGAYDAEPGNPGIG